jgi:hypothetical protein
VTLALSSGVVLAWWLSLAAGLVIALVVWGHLELLRRSVEDVREGVDAVLGAGGRLAQNTATTHLFATTRARGLDLLAELEHHPAREGAEP